MGRGGGGSSSSSANPGSAKASRREGSLADFGKSAQDAADSVERRFGDDKVFIHDAYEAARKKDPGLTRARFDERLLAAHRAGHVELARADLVTAMRPSDVAASRVTVPKPKGLGGESTEHVNFILAKKRRR
jgi:hypothetical protein